MGEKKIKIIKASKIITLCVLIIGILIGSGIVALGIIKTNEIKNDNKQIARKIENKYDSVTSAKAQEKLEKYIISSQEKITTLENEIDTLGNEQKDIFFKERFSNNYYSKETEIKDKRNELSTLNQKVSTVKKTLSNIHSGKYDEQMRSEIRNEKKDEEQYQHYYYIGFAVILLSFVLSALIFFITKNL